MAPSQRYVRGIFSGGTFCFEAQLIHAAAGITAFSNTPTAGNARLANVGKSEENTIIDMGDDEFTQGRPHPMIDPSPARRAHPRGSRRPDDRGRAFRCRARLRLGRQTRPPDCSASSVRPGESESGGPPVAFIGYVCGTDQDPQNRSKVVAGLEVGRRAGRIVQRRGRHLVGRRHCRTPEEPQP